MGLSEVQELKVDVELDKAEDVSGETEETEIEEIESEDGESEELAEDEQSEVDEEFSITLDLGEGDETGEEDTPPIRKLRQLNRAKEKRVKELERQLAEYEKPAQRAEKPTLEAFDFDAEAFEKALLDWNAQESAAQADQEKAEQERQKHIDAFNAKVSVYEENKAKLPVDDFAEVEEGVKSILSDNQQSILMHLAEKPETLVYAIGKNSTLAEQLAGITDPIEYAHRLGQIESKMKVTGMKPKKPAPERRLSGNTPAPKSGKKQLEALKRKADESGDYTEYFAAKRAAKAK